MGCQALILSLLREQTRCKVVKAEKAFLSISTTTSNDRGDPMVGDWKLGQKWGGWGARIASVHLRHQLLETSLGPSLELNFSTWEAAVKDKAA